MITALTKLETEKLENIRGEVHYRFRQRKGPTHVRAKFTSPAAWCEWMVKATAKDIGIPWKISLAEGSVPAIRAEMFRSARERIDQLRGITYGPIISQIMARLYASYVTGPEPLGRGTVPASVETPKMDIQMVGWKWVKSPPVHVGRPQLLLMDKVSP